MRKGDGKPFFKPDKPERGARDGLPTTAEAEEVAIAALAFLAAEPGRLARFMGATGLDVGDLARGAAGPEVLGAMLDHLLEDESLLLVFAAEHRIAPERVGPARQALSGGGAAS